MYTILLNQNLTTQHYFRENKIFFLDGHPLILNIQFLHKKLTDISYLEIDYFREFTLNGSEILLQVLRRKHCGRN